MTANLGAIQKIRDTQGGGVNEVSHEHLLYTTQHELSSIVGLLPFIWFMDSCSVSQLPGRVPVLRQCVP